MKLLRARPMTCRDAVEQASASLDQRLPFRDRRRLEHHLARCPHCIELLAQLRLTITLARRSAAEPS